MMHTETFLCFGCWRHQEVNVLTNVPPEARLRYATPYVHVQLYITSHMKGDVQL